MPCQSYDNDWDRGNDSRKIAELKKQCDKLARIACKALTELEKNQVEDLLLLSDDEVREWWQKHKEADRKERERLAEIERRERIKAEALAKLSSEEREILGIESKKNKGKKLVKSSNANTIVYDIDSLLKQLNKINYDIDIGGEYET